jgi:5-methylcytosine-specific restriction endonuclease McrA
MGLKPKQFLPNVCVICDKTFEKPKNVSAGAWVKRQCCCLACAIVYSKKNNNGFKKGHPSYSTAHRFEKGHVPANKGLHVKSNDALDKYRASGKHPLRGGHLSEETRKKISLTLTGRKMKTTKGKKHWNWKGGKTPLRKKIQALYLYDSWRKSVYKRDDYTCQDCGAKGVYLNADHIKPYSVIIKEQGITTVRKAKKCLELWDVANGKTLCVPCHRKTETYGGSRKT